MNIQHSSRSDLWYSPTNLVESSRFVLGGITLDPASDIFGNSRVKANNYFDEKQDGLAQFWFGSVFCNPPGGKVGKKSKSALFWDKLIVELVAGRVSHAIYLAFSLEQMQTTQKSVCSIVNFPFCVPSKRVRFDAPDGIPGKAPSHSNVIVYLPGTVDKTLLFREEFSQYGAICIPRDLSTYDGWLPTFERNATRNRSTTILPREVRIRDSTWRLIQLSSS